MDPELRRQVLELCKKYDGSTGNDLALAMIAARLELVYVLLLKLDHPKVDDELLRITQEHDEAFLEFCDSYLGLIHHHNPTSEP